jgi:hypothetical protein
MTPKEKAEELVDKMMLYFYEKINNSNCMCNLIVCMW